MICPGGRDASSPERGFESLHSAPPQDKVSLCSPGYPGTHLVDQAGLKLRSLPASASQSAGITVVIPPPGPSSVRSKPSFPLEGMLYSEEL